MKDQRTLYCFSPPVMIATFTIEVILVFTDGVDNPMNGSSNNVSLRDVMKRAEEEDTLMRRLFGVRVIIGKIGVSLLGLLGGLTIGREGPTVHIGAAIMAEIRRFYPHRTAQLERRLDQGQLRGREHVEQVRVDRLLGDVVLEN